MIGLILFICLTVCLYMALFSAIVSDWRNDTGLVISKCAFWLILFFILLLIFLIYT